VDLKVVDAPFSSFWPVFWGLPAWLLILFMFLGNTDHAIPSWIARSAVFQILSASLALFSFMAAPFIVPIFSVAFVVSVGFATRLPLNEARPKRLYGIALLVYALGVLAGFFISLQMWQGF
jgi:hypothetical protein